MFERLIPFYREKENFTLFYDQHKNQFYRLPHKGKVGGLYWYYLLPLAVLYGSSYLNDLYQPYKSVGLNLFCSIVLLPFCYIIAKLFYKNYYIQANTKEFYTDSESLRGYAEQGKKQFKREMYGVLFIFIITCEFKVLYKKYKRITP